MKAGGETYLSSKTIIDEENMMEQQLDRGSTRAPHFPLMLKGGKFVDRARILP